VVAGGSSRAGRFFGVLGATLAFRRKSIGQELKWIDDHVDGKPYGLDVLIPENISTAGPRKGRHLGKVLEAADSRPSIAPSPGNLLKKYGVELTTTDVARTISRSRSNAANARWKFSRLRFRHPIRLIANALGVPPKAMIEMGRQHGVPVAALGRRQGTRAPAQGRGRPVEILVVQGTEGRRHIAARFPPWCWCRR